MQNEQIERVSASNPYKNTLRKLENIRNICKEKGMKDFSKE
jgi:hypothetical protein